MASLGLPLPVSAEVPQNITFLTPEEQSRIPDDIKEKILLAVQDLNRRFHGAVATRENDKENYETRIAELENEIASHISKVEALKVQLSDESKSTEVYIEKYKEAITSSNELDAKIRQCQTEAHASKLKCDQAIAEKEDLSAIVEKRNAEISKLMADIQNITQELQSATISKINALTKVDETLSKEMELDYKEKHMQKEAEWVQKQVQLLNEELDRKNADLLTQQKDSTLKYMGLQVELTEKTEQVRIAEMSLNNVKKINEEQERHIERLIEKLREAQEVEAKLVENYRQELKSQKKIADLYKESSEDASKKVEELEDAAANLQELLKHATERYGDLETRFVNAGKSFQEEISVRDEKIQSLSKELLDANELLNSVKKHGMTEEMIHSLSPAAAAASSMLKNTHSLTEIYSRYQSLHAELEIAKMENEKLNNYINEIVKDIEERTPGIRQQREDYENAVKTVDILNSQLELAVEENGKSKTEIATFKKSVGTLDRENERLKLQLSDLAVQVKTLLKEVEVNRGNYQFEDLREVPEISSTSSSQVISNRLVTFRDISELQSQNQQLLAVVRELSESQENAEKRISENQMQQIKEAFEAAKAEMEELRAIRMRQDKMMEQVVKQRDTYSALLKTSKPTDKDKSFNQVDIAELEKKLSQSQFALSSLKEEYDTYKKEKATNDRMTDESMEKLRDDIAKMRVDNSKLASQVEYNNERAKIYNANVQTFKKNIAVLEEKNKQYSMNVFQFEQNIQALKNELHSTQRKLAQVEVSLSSMTQERDALRDSKSRLQAERDMFQREKTTQQSLQTNLEEIKNTLGMANNAIKMRLENQIDTLQQECNMLRQKVDTENDRFKDAVLSWDTTNKALRDKVTSDQALLATVKSELEASKNQIQKQTSEIEELTSQVNILSRVGSGAAATPTSASSQLAVDMLNPKIFTLEKKAKELNLQLIDSQTEIRSLRQQLDISRASIEEYKNLCASMEEQLKSTSNNSSAFHDELNERLACKDDIIRDIQSRLDVIEKENHSLKEERTKLSSEFQGKNNILEEEISRMRRELQSANLKLQGVIEENCNIKNDLERNVQISKELQQKWETEQANHAQEYKVNGELQLKVESLQLKFHDEEIVRMKAETSLKEARLSFEKRENALNENSETMKKKMEELETLNLTLQNQLINSTTQTNSLQQAGVNQPSSSTNVGETPADGDPKNSEQWLQLIKYLRREKEIANTKTEMAMNTSQRLEGQLQYAEKQCEELRKQLTDIQERSQVTVITSVKQAELLRKVETLSALTDSNRMLREEKDNAIKEITDLKSRLEQVEAEIGPLRANNIDLEAKCEALSTENMALKQDVTRWRTRASALVEKSNKVNPEEMKRLQTENDNFLKQLQSLQDNAKKQQQEITRQAQQIRMMQQQAAVLQSSNQSLQQERKNLQEENKRLQDESSQGKSENEKFKSESESIRTQLADKEASVKRLTAELKKSQTQTEEQKNTVKQVKNIARKYKKQFEDLKAEQEAGTSNSEQNPTAGVSDANVATAGTTTEDLVPQQQESLELAARDVRINELIQENERLKQDMESSKGDSSQKQEQTKLAMKNLRDKLTAVTQQKDEVQTERDEVKVKLSSMEVSSEENAVRFAALKSQYEGRLTRLEKENKELKAAASSSNNPVAGTSDMAAVNSTLQQENDRQKKELDMLKQRLLAIEKQFKLQSQQHSSKGVTPSGDKTQSDPPKANIKPIAGTSSSNIQKPATQIVPTAISRPPLTASIRPMSMQIRKATVMPTTATATAMPTQQSSQSQQQPTSLSVQPLSNFVAPVSQAQVSTSTPDQSSATETATQHLPVTSSASTPITVNSTNVRQATVQPTLTVTVAPIPTAVASVVAPQGTSDNESGSGLREDPSTSTSHVMDSEMGDSSEQVSSSESSSTHQPMLTVAPIRSQQQDHVQQSDQAGPSQTTGNQSIPGLEEPSPSTSTSAPRPSQSGKRARDSEVETSQESQNSDEPESKRSRTIPMPIDREAEAMSHQQEQPHQQSEPNDSTAQEQEADQGRNDDENQMPHSDTSERKPAGSAQRGRMQDDDDDSDVIVIDSDDEDSSPHNTVQRGMTSRQQQELVDDDDDDDEEDEEDIEDDDDLAEDEDIDEEEDVDDDDQDDDDDDQDDEGLDHDNVDDHEEDDDVEHEDREAESLEHEGESQEADEMSMEQQEADILDEGEYDSHGEVHGDDQERHDEVESAGTAAVGSPYRSGSSGQSASARDTSPGTSSDVVRSGSQLRSLTRSGRQDRLPSFGRQQLTPSSFPPQTMYPDEMEDSIVPSTPTLFVPRRSDGFAEAVSSPQIPNQPRFTFSAPSDTTTPAGSSEMEDTRIDFLQYDDSTGRSVPTTPLQVSPPDVADLSSELDSHINDMHESVGASQEIIDGQPSSSDASRSTNTMEVPTITVTSAQVDSAADQEGEEDNANLDSELAGISDAQMHSVPMRTEASVTSSDEDKLDGASAGIQLQPSTSSSSRAASPTPSSAPQTPHDQPIPQQHRVRPTPIIWDQPTSSSSVPPTSRLPRGRGGLLARQMQAPPEQGMSMSLSRGGFRQLRGAQQSARRSRPHSRGIIRGTPFNKPY